MLPTNDFKSSSTPFEMAETTHKESKLSFNIEIELDSLAELIINSTHVPLTEFIVIDRVILLHQINQIKENLPLDFATAIEIANRKQQIISEAENYAFSLIKSAEEEVSQILRDSTILSQAELDGAKVRLKTEQDCEHLKQTTINEVMQLRQNAIAECQEIQMGADNYADDVLGDIEQKLQKMLTIIQNGRQQLD